MNSPANKLAAVVPGSPVPTARKGEKKRQHYVPRLILRRFAPDTINTSVLVMKNGKVVPSAPLKHQCYGDYFYGADQVIEDAFQETEAEFSRIIGNLTLDELEAVTDNEESQLKHFMHYQAARTRAAVEEMNNYISSMAGRTLLRAAERNGENVDELKDVKVCAKNGAMQSVLMAARTTPAVLDLAVKFILTDRTPGFIVGDHPVVASNQFAEHHPVLGRYPNITGLFMKGLQLFLPLSPSVTLMVYDPTTYEVDGKGKTCKAGPGEVRFLNAMQTINAWECAYFDEKRMTERELEELLQIRRAHRDVHLTDAGDVLVENHEQADCIVAVRRDIRVGARFGFLRVTNKLPYDCYDGATVPVRSESLCAIAEQYSDFIGRKLGDRRASEVPSASKFTCIPLSKLSMRSNHG